MGSDFVRLRLERPFRLIGSRFVDIYVPHRRPFYSERAAILC